MTPFHRATAATVTLTRFQVESILMNWMGWEAEDVTSFWRAALREAKNPGCIDRELEAKFARSIKRALKAGES